jgi:hypothetical protein
MRKPEPKGPATEGCSPLDIPVSAFTTHDASGRLAPSICDGARRNAEHFSYRTVSRADLLSVQCVEDGLRGRVHRAVRRVAIDLRGSAGCPPLIAPRMSGARRTD